MRTSPFGQLTVDLGLFLFGWCLTGFKEEKLSSKKPHSLCAVLVNEAEFMNEFNIGGKRDVVTVHGCAFLVPQLFKRLAGLLLFGIQRLIVGRRFAGRADDELSGVSIENGRGAFPKPTIAGIPRARARMAVCELTLPPSVTNPRSLLRSIEAVSEGVMS